LLVSPEAKRSARPGGLVVRLLRHNRRVRRRWRSRSASRYWLRLVVGRRFWANLAVHPRGRLAVHPGLRLVVGRRFWTNLAVHPRGRLAVHPGLGATQEASRLVVVLRVVSAAVRFGGLRPSGRRLPPQIVRLFIG
jgi:hypothetical protein